jgi:hypothetical protein
MSISGDDAQHQGGRTKRMTRSVGLVLIGTAAFMLGMPGCDNRGGTTRPTTRSSRSSSYHSHGYYGGGRRTNGSSLAHSGGHTARGGFGSTGHGVGS